MAKLTRRAMLCAVTTLTVTRVVGARESDWLPMAEFDPSTPALVHDNLNDQVIEWEPEMHQQDYERYAHRQFGNGMTEWDGLLLDGWKLRTLH